MKLIVEVPNSLYANLSKIQRGSIASKRILDCVKNGTPLNPLGEEMRITQKAITDEKVLIGFNMAVALCNKHFGENTGVTGNERNNQLYK